MSKPADTRLHPIAALRAVHRLVRDPEDTKQAFLLVAALRGKTVLRQFARFRATETGRAILAQRRSLLARLSDRASLAQLLPGSLGRAYYDFMASEQLSADGLVDASKATFDHAIDDITWFRERIREMHDLLHVTLGYGRDPLGEACVVAFSFAQIGLKGFAIIALFAGLRITRQLRDPRALRAVYEAYRRGRLAAWVVAVDWESLLSQSLDIVRVQLRIIPAVHYPRLLPSMQRALTAPTHLPRAATA